MNNFDFNNNNIYDDEDLTNQIYQNENEEHDLENNDNEEEEIEDDRLTYTLITLDLGNLIHIFEENNISFIDMLLLTKEDLKELQLSLYQRNRIYNFSILFNKYAKNYSIGEISDFFSFNKQFIFNSSIYDRVNMVSQNNLEKENNYIYNENNLDDESDYYNNNDYNNVENNNNYYNLNSKFNQQNYFNGAVKKSNYDYTPYNQINIHSSKLNLKKDNNSKIKNNVNNNNIENIKQLKNSNQFKNDINNYFNIHNNNINNVNNDNNQIKRNININNKKNNNTYNNINDRNKKYSNSNKKKNSAINNFLSIKKDTDDFLTKLNIQKEQSEIKRDKATSLINRPQKYQFSQYKKIDELIINNNQEKNIDNIINIKYKDKGNITNEKDINEEYQKMLNKIDEIELMKMDYNSYSHLNQIKNYINNKGDNILIEDINRVNEEIDKMIEILNEKEKLKKALENCNLKIKQKKEMINNIDKIEENNNINIINMIKDNKKEIGNKENNNEIKYEHIENIDEFGANNENKKIVEEVVEVEEEYDNDNDFKNRKK